MTYVSEGKDVATLRAEQAQAQVRDVLDVAEEAARLIRSAKFRAFLSDLAYEAVDLADEVEMPEWCPSWMRLLADEIVGWAQLNGAHGVEMLKQANEAAKGEEIHA